MSELRETDWATRTVGEVVTEDYGRAAVFRAFDIDFCCGGSSTVAAACEAAGVPYEAVAQALTASREWLHEDESAHSDPATWDLDVLAGYIVRVHHGYLRETLPLLLESVARIADVHGARHPELHDVKAMVLELADELNSHMREEEQVLFPGIAALVAGGPAMDVGALLIPLEDDHTRVGELVRRIRKSTGDYRVPADGCTTYRGTYEKLSEFEEDLHRHVHLENNILFPRAAALAAALGSAR